MPLPPLQQLADPRFSLKNQITATANDRHQHAEVTDSMPKAIRRMSIQEPPEDPARDHVVPV
ncbi:hypothetical protein CpipJ_CPIJ007105 [Culex quinquefasciatus]|uniref:Uncharacterized protein n=1 Tax=Culex quinquefasciatus TaxID=7176 RepID=B0WK50_CULQU|nr:hypothetical protein CpipJ_CPIJ007105 [Culex quinquefasciatus]|eukprot:XP_001849084.1 hypothetical protein CpipJ_CPIJ007105 [Culex quinquefasciatus]